MGVALLVCRLVLAGVFLVAGPAKLLDPAGSRKAVADFGVPEGLARPAGLLLPLAELAIGIALVPVGWARFGALGAATLLLAFVAAIGNALAHGRAPECHCFGQVHSAPAGWTTLVRNAALLGLAGFVAVGGWRDGGASATAWIGHTGAVWLGAGAATVVVVAIVGFQTWFSLQLLAQNGRIVGRLEAIEAALAGVEPRERELEELEGGGLEPGTPAPAFTLQATGGGSVSLEDLLDEGSPVLLAFTDAGCGPCNALMPELASWQSELRHLLTVAVVASGDEDGNRAKAEEHGLQRVLLQREREVSDAFRSVGTPSAVLIGTDGTIGSPLVGGSVAIERLVKRAARPGGANGRERARVVPRHDPPADTSRIGSPAPELALTALDGQETALADFYGAPTLLLFWNPDCGFCEGMLDDLRTFEAEPPEGAPRLVVVARGDRERLRAQRLASPVLLDEAGEAADAFGAGGTPMAVLVEAGAVASPVAAGAAAVLELVRRPIGSPRL